MFPSAFSILALVSTEKDLNEGFLVFKRKNWGLGKRETDSSVFRDWKGGLVLETLSITMIMKAGNTICNHVSNKLSWRIILYSQHGVQEENSVTLHACRFFSYLYLLGFLVSLRSISVHACLSLKFILPSMDIGGENDHRFSLFQLNFRSVCPPFLCRRKSIQISIAPREIGRFPEKIIG